MIQNFYQFLDKFTKTSRKSKNIQNFPLIIIKNLNLSINPSIILKMDSVIKVEPEELHTIIKTEKDPQNEMLIEYLPPEDQQYQLVAIRPEPEDKFESCVKVKTLDITPKPSITSKPLIKPKILVKRIFPMVQKKTFELPQKAPIKVVKKENPTIKIASVNQEVKQAVIKTRGKNVVKFSEFQCKVCLKYLSRKEGLERHLSLHYDPVILRCEYCWRTLRSQKSYQDHKEKHQKCVKKCNKCQKTFNGQFYSESHKCWHRTVKEEKK